MPGYPPNPYKTGTQKFNIYRMLTDRGEVNGLEFIRAGITEFRTRANEIDKDLQPKGFTIRHRFAPGNRYVNLSIIKIPTSLYDEAV